jgi:two-component system NarL family sensor kinase
MLADADLAGAIGGVLRELQVNTLTQVSLDEEPGASSSLSDQQAGELFLVAQEALANARKHARATEISASLSQADGQFAMSIADNGIGFDRDVSTSGHGLRNMRERVEKLGGRLTIAPNGSTGSKITVEVPTQDATG